MAEPRRKKWWIVRNRGRLDLRSEMPRMYLPNCAVCKLPLLDRNKIAMRLFIGDHQAEIGADYGLNQHQIWKHANVCIPQVIEAAWRQARQRDVDNILRLEGMVLETFETLKAGIESNLAQKDTNAALAISEDFVAHLDSFTVMLTRIDRNRDVQASEVIRGLSSALVKADPVGGSDVINALLEANPAIMNLLEEGKANVRHSDNS